MEAVHVVLRAVHRIILVAVAAGLCWLLVRRFGPWAGLGVWAVVTGAACAASAAILRTSSVGRVTWKNRQAGYFLPWGYGLAGGRLAWIALISWGIWVLIGIGVVVLGRTGSASTPVANSPAPGAWSWLLLAAWAIDTAALIYLLGVVVRSFAPGSGSGRRLLTLVAILGLMLAASTALHLAGYTRTAVLVAGGPPAIVGILYGLFVLMIVTVGRNARWN